MALTPLEEVLDVVLGACARLHPRAVPLEDALGCVAAAAVQAEESVPPFANTAMDGFAVRAADTSETPAELKVVGTIAAGAAPDVEVGPGQAVRIMTGAPIPRGADAVVMVENTSVDDDVVTVERPARAGDHIREAGDDLRPGEVVIEPDTVLGAGHLGVLASLGIQRMPVYPWPRVGVVSTGDELVEGPVELRPGQIRDSNRPTLLALARRCGFDAVDLGLIRDDEDAIEAAVRRGLAGCDALVTSGGVSVGDFDYMKAVLARLGEVRSWQVAIKPAKPFAFAVVDGKPVFGLPGNPVSSMVSFELFARPALRRMGGHTELGRPTVEAVADEPLRRRPDGKLHLLRVVAVMDDEGRWRARPVAGQGSHQLWAAAGANALALVPDGEGVEVGGHVRVLLTDLC